MSRSVEHKAGAADRTPEISLFFFADRAEAVDGMELVSGAVRAADRGGLCAAWFPELHFGEFGGLYPDPSLLCAYFAGQTESLQLRAGSVVLPLHDVPRVAEAWSLVDQMTGGRVGISVANGWQPEQFVLSRKPFAERRSLAAQQVAQLARLWGGQSIELSDASGQRRTVQTYPRPVQPELPLWITCSSNPDGWSMAATLGANVLTGLLELTEEQVFARIRQYRRGMADQHGRTGHVTLMMHTAVATTWTDNIHVETESALKNYLTNHLAFYERMLKERESVASDVQTLTAADKEALIDRGVRRYLRRHALVGDEAAVAGRLAEIAGIGVDEVACLVNFGRSHEAVLTTVNSLVNLQASRNVTVAAT